ncbi:calcium/sodium antiporter [Albirhodobacter sp. R86504]|jgi:cation:H+ antiporter|uniref:calcium/sodium antiporter n=1 Tax=Albirhodobacter sp. R86504 TaxID=3093848 RepID=UPI003671EEAC
MMISLGMVALGLVLLVGAGDILVRGATGLAFRLGIPPLIVGLTVVAFGTSAPELMVSVAAVLDNSPGIALGNVVGSNIANVLLVLGLPALIATVHTHPSETRQSYLIMIGASVLFIVLCFLGPIRLPHALVLLTALFLMIFGQVRNALTHRASNAGRAQIPEDALEQDPQLSSKKIALFLILGLIGLPVGADFLVKGATDIALAAGLSEAVIGLTLVAIGTSLPELATSLTAAFKGRTDLMMGNVIGSNIFNILCIIGFAGLIGPLPVPAEMLRFDIWVMLAAAIVMLPFAMRGVAITRKLGLCLTGAYAAYVLAIIA